MNVSYYFRFLASSFHFYEMFSSSIHYNSEGCKRNDETRFLSKSYSVSRYSSLYRDSHILHEYWSSWISRIKTNSITDPFSWRPHLRLSDSNQERWKVLRFCLSFKICAASSNSYNDPLLVINYNGFVVRVLGKQLFNYSIKRQIPIGRLF